MLEKNLQVTSRVTRSKMIHSSPTKDVTTTKKTRINNNTLDFNLLTLASLRKYRRVYHLNLEPTSSKSELVKAASDHFGTIPINEDQIINTFISTARNIIADGKIGMNFYGGIKKTRIKKALVNTYMTSKKSRLVKAITDGYSPTIPRLQENM